MRQSYVLAAAAVLVIAVAAAGVYTMVRHPDLLPEKPLPPDISAPVLPRPDQPEPVPSEQPQFISATRTYKDGVYHVEGSLTLPTPCHQLLIDPRILESYPEQVAVDFTIRDSGNICVQVLHEQAWEFDVRVSEQASFSARINGQPAYFDWGTK